MSNLRYTDLVYAEDNALKPSSPTWDLTKAYEQLFILPPDILNIVDSTEETKTYMAMVDLGIDNAPYDEFSIKYKHRGITSEIAGKWAEILVHYRIAPREGKKPLIELAIAYYRELPNGPNMVKDVSFQGREVHSALSRFSQALYVSLLVLLAARNVEKVKATHKLPRSMGKHATQTVTTIRIGKITETEYEKGEPTGRVMRAHLRRGHIRRQHHGPGNSYEKKIWIPPVFVNSDREYVPREAYNVSFTH